MASSRLLALEWDGREARLAVAALRGGQVLVEQAFSIPFESRGEASADAAETGRQIAAALASRRIGRVETLVAIGRASIELKRLTLPPAPDEELPSMVRFQALREFNALAEDWPLDFVPLDEDPAAPRNVLAAAVAPDLVKQIRQTCEAAGLNAEHLVLRPYAAASLFTQRESTAAGTRLLVDLLADEVDLTVMVGRKVVFLRTARLRDPLADPEGLRSLLGEVRRTLAAAQHQLGGQRVEGLHLCGAGPAHVELARQLSEELKLPTSLFNPWDGIALGSDLKGGLPDNAGRYAPLLGLLVDETAGAAHALDFLCPRRPPAPPSRRRRYLGIGAAAAAAVALLALTAAWRVLSLNSEIDRLARESKSWDVSVEQAAKVEKISEEITTWQVRDVNWLDELRLLSERFPEAKDGMLTGLTMSTGEQGGQVQLDGLVREAGVVSTLESRLRDERRRVGGNSRQQDASQKPYAWRFSSTVVVASDEQATAETTTSCARVTFPSDRSERRKVNKVQRREKILAAAVAALVALLGLHWVYGAYSGAVSERQARVERLRHEVAAKKAQVAAADRTARELAELEARALPTDRDLARTLYQNWLLEQVVTAKLHDATVSSSRGFARGDAFYLLPFTVRAKGGLDDLTRLLYAFYSAPHLHQVRRLSIKPIEGSTDLDFSLAVEALALPRADRDDALSPAPADRLAPRKAADYALISKRNLFAPYQPQVAPTGKPRPPAPSFNDAEYAVLTALIGVGPQPQAWISVRTTGELLKVGVGDEIRVGQFKGRVARIGPRDMEVRSEKGSLLVALGKSLSQGTPLSSEAARRPQP